MRTIQYLIVAVFLSLAFVSGATAQIELRAEITGRITTEENAPAKRVSVTVMDLNTLETRTVMTNHFGYYRVRDLQFGSIFIVGVKSKSYYFASPFQTVILDLVTREVMFTGSKFRPPSVVAADVDEPLVIVSKEP